VTTDVLWSAWDGRGIEHLRLDAGPGAVRADSLIVSVAEGRPFRARYVLECDVAWRLRRARIEVLDEPARILEVTIADGRWTDVSTGAPIELDACVDIDIYPSPFTNTLPIRRLADTPAGRPVRITAAWVHLPALTIHAAPQEYTLLERLESGARWLFRALDSNFTAELDVDAQGIVRDYPDIAKRLL
jgi:hypothetical protein